MSKLHSSSLDDKGRLTVRGVHQEQVCEMVWESWWCEGSIEKWASVVCFVLISRSNSGESKEAVRLVSGEQCRATY